MGLIICPECNINVSSLAIICPNCGYPMSCLKSGRGNSIGNNINTAYICSKDNLEWIFCNYPADYNYLYAINKKTNERKLLIKESCSDINIFGNRIYFTNDFGICSCDLEGKNRYWHVKGDYISSVNIVDGWIYYSEHQNIQDGVIYKIKIDGTEKTLLSYNSTTTLAVSEGWIYYINMSDNYRIYKMKIDGTNESVLTEDSACYLNVNGIWVYYSNINDGRKIYKILGNGSKKTKLNDDDSYCLNFYKDWIYYITKKGRNVLTGEVFAIFSGEVFESSFGNIEAYYINGKPTYGDCSFYKQPKKITSRECSNINIVDDTIYCEGINGRFMVFDIPYIDKPQETDFE